MTCVSKDGHMCTSLQTEPALPNGQGLLAAIRFARDIFKHAFELSQACNLTIQKRRGRRRLRELDDQLLKDIGITREQAERAARKWFWQ